MVSEGLVEGAIFKDTSTKQTTEGNFPQPIQLGGG